jgi:oligopeptide transport system permease protein
MIMIFMGLIVLLVLPREIQITHVYNLVFKAEYPFSMELFFRNLTEFFQHLQSQKGFGFTRTGVPIVEEVSKLLGRSLLIIIPCFVLSIIFGLCLGVVQFFYHEKFVGKLLSFLSWSFSSIPDFFLYMGVQYLFIKLIQAGFPRFSLYGQDHWYSFILPLVSLMLFPLIYIAKYITSSLVYEATQDYVRTSYAKGLVKRQVLLHMLKNGLPGLLNQTQVVMVYILTSLPIIEKLSSYRGAGLELLNSILRNDDALALAFMIPFVLIMFMTIVTVQILKQRIIPQMGSEHL